jgi:hypothetical protein
VNTAKAKGGARCTHTTLAIARLEELAMEAHAAEAELVERRMSPTEVSWRYRRFAAEVKRLAFEEIRHLRLLQPGELPAVDALVAERLAAA